MQLLYLTFEPYFGDQDPKVICRSKATSDSRATFGISVVLRDTPSWLSPVERKSLVQRYKHERAEISCQSVLYSVCAAGCRQEFYAPGRFTTCQTSRASSCPQQLPPRLVILGKKTDCSHRPVKVDAAVQLQLSWQHRIKIAGLLLVLQPNVSRTSVKRVLRQNGLQHFAPEAKPILTDSRMQH